MKQVVRRRVVLAGRVVDGATGKPQPGARVEFATVPASLEPGLAARRLRHGAAWAELEERPDRARTDAAGRFAFVDLPSGPYTLAALLPGSGSRYGVASAKAQVKRSKDGDASLAWVELELPATSITGKVTGPGSKPVPLASVQVKGSPEHTFTDAHGRYALSGLEAGPHTLLVRARGFKPAESAGAPAKPGSSKAVNVALTPVVP